MAAFIRRSRQCVRGKIKGACAVAYGNPGQMQNDKEKSMARCDYESPRSRDNRLGKKEESKR